MNVIQGIQIIFAKSKSLLICISRNGAFAASYPDSWINFREIPVNDILLGCTIVLI